MVSFKSPKTDLLNRLQMKISSFFKHFLVCFFFTYCMGSNIGYSQQSCENDLQLISKTSNDSEVSINLKIATSAKFTCILYAFQDGQYVETSRKTGNDESDLTFSSLEKNTVYKVIAEFKSGSTFCRIRQIGGLSL